MRLTISSGSRDEPGQLHLHRERPTEALVPAVADLLLRHVHILPLADRLRRADRIHFPLRSRREVTRIFTTIYEHLCVQRRHP